MKFQLSDESSSVVEELQVPFLVINEPLDKPILGLNAIKLLVNYTSNENGLINTLQINIKNIKSNNIEALINLISQLTDHDEFLVHGMPSTTIVPTGKLINIQCKINLGNLNNRIPMLFDQHEIFLLVSLQVTSVIQLFLQFLPVTQHQFGKNNISCRFRN